MSARLLFDQNLSPKLIKRLADLYPNSDHLNMIELGTADDITVWEHAKRNNFVIITKDADFADLSVLRGFPPKVVWIRRGNCSTANIAEILCDHNAKIKDLQTDLSAGILTLF